MKLDWMTRLAAAGLLSIGFCSAGLAQNEPQSQQAYSANQAAGSGMQGNTAVGQPIATLGSEPINPVPQQSPEVEKFIDQVLTYWTEKSKSIERYECNFTRWTYQFTAMKDVDPNLHYAKDAGIIKHAPPDKGVFKVEEQMFYVVDGRDPAKSGYRAMVDASGNATRYGEWWLCDGTAVHEYDRTQKTVRVYPIPKELQGKEIVKSPLPFFFGVDPAVVRQRYWIKYLPSPTDAQGNPRQDLIVLEFFPKTMGDSMNYKSVQVFLDKNDFLPATIVQFMTDHTPATPNKLHYEFTDRKVNPSQGLPFFRKQFIPLDVPSDWQVIEQEVPGQGQPADAGRVATPNLNAGQIR
jgi:TIGR03009 family protein